MKRPPERILPFPSLPFPSLPFPSFPFPSFLLSSFPPSLPPSFPSLPFPSFPFFSFFCVLQTWSAGTTIKRPRLKLRPCVYIHIRQLSSFRAPTWWFIDPTVATCHIQYNFLSLCPFLARENVQNTEILGVHHFRMIRKWPPTASGRAKH